MENLMKELNLIREQFEIEYDNAICKAESKGLRGEDLRNDVDVRIAKAQYKAFLKAFTLTSDKLRDLRNLVSRMSDF